MTKHYAGARIHALRKERNLTQTAMAKQLGLSTSYLNQLENDQRPLTVTVLMQLTQRFDVDPTYFSPVKDVRTISDLRAIFPQAPESTISEIAARYPELMPELVDIARRVPDSRPAGSYEVVRDFFYDANNYIHELDVLAEERGSVPVPSLSSRQARWGAVLLVLGALLVLGNLVVCLTRAWAYSGLAIPGVIATGLGVVLLELSPEAGVCPWWADPDSGDTSSVEDAGSEGPSGVAA